VRFIIKQTSIGDIVSVALSLQLANESARASPRVFNCGSR